MTQSLTAKELEKIYNILKAFDGGLLVNPNEDWELDYHDEKLVDNKGLKPILKKLKLALPKKSFENVEKKVLLRRYDTFNNDINESAYRNAMKAFNDKLTLEMKYFSMSKEKPIERKVDTYAKNSKYLMGFCHLRQAIRKFRLSRIMRAKVTDEKYKIPRGFDKRRYL